VSEVTLLLTAVAVLLSEPSGHRALVGRVGALASVTLAVIGVWSRAPQRRLTAAVGACAGLVSVAPGPLPWSMVAVLAACLACAACGWLLCARVPPILAAVAVVAVAAATAGDGGLGWLLPVLTAAAGWCVARRRPWDAALLAVVAGLAGPAGIGVGVAVVGVACAAARSLQPALLLVPAAAVWWWQLPASWPELVGSARWEPALAPVLLLPMALTGVAERLRTLLRERRTGWSSAACSGWLDLAAPVAGLAVALAVGGGAGATAALLLLLVPINGGGGVAWAERTAAWTGATAAVAALLPGTGTGWLSALGLLGAALWLVGWLVSSVPHRLSQLVWLAPVLALPWVVPVEGVDRRLAADATLEGRGDGLALVAQLGAAEKGQAAVATVGSDPVVEVGQRIGIPRRGGEGAEERWVVQLPSGAPLAATTDLVIRTEPRLQWAARGHRLRVLGVGGGILAAAVLWLSPSWGRVAVAWLLGWLLAAASGVAPLARLGVRDAADAAAVLWLLLVAVAVPRLGRRWFAAGLLVLVPLAVAQPVLRHPAGDEVYHIQLLESLLADGDLDISNNLDPEQPSEAIYIPHGDELIHTPTVALAVAPGWLLAGHAGALAVLALLAAATAALVARRSLRLGVPPRCVRCGWWLVIASYPMVTFATQLWPAVPGAFLVALLLQAVGERRPLAAGLALAVSLLVKVRLALLSVPVALAWSVRRSSRRWLPLIAAAAAVGVVGVVLVYGSPLGRHAVSELLPDAPAVLAARLWGLMVDGAGGLLLHAPLWLLALGGVMAVWRRGGAGERGLIVGAALTVVALTNRGEWYGGGSPPARYLVPLLPLVQMALAEVARRRGGRRLMLLAAPWTVVVTWVAVTRPLWLFNPVDGGWWWVDRLGHSLATDIRRTLPSVLAPTAATYLVPLLLAVVAAWWWRSRAGSSAAVTLVLIAVLLVVGTGVPSARVEAEAGGVVTRGGNERPPPGTFNRAAGALGWQLVHDATLEVRWRVPYGRRPWARVELIGDRTRVTRLWVCWEGQTPREVPLVGADWTGRRWRWVALPPPPRLGSSRLKIRFDGLPDAWRTHAAIDRLEAR
jgi:hypothetical protein